MLERAAAEHHRHRAPHLRLALTSACVFAARRPEDAGAALVEVGQIVLEDRHVAVVQVLVQPAERLGAVRHHHQAVFAAGVAVASDEGGSRLVSATTSV